jgi:hypothetical protein
MSEPIDLDARRAAREYDSLLSLDSQLEVVIRRAMREMHGAGATSAHIARVLRFAASEIEAGEPSRGAS